MCVRAYGRVTQNKRQTAVALGVRGGGGGSLPTTCSVACVCPLCLPGGGWATKGAQQGAMGESGFDGEARISNLPD